LKGSAIKTLTGIVHYSDCKTILLCPSQLTISVEKVTPSFCLISMVY